MLDDELDARAPADVQVEAAAFYYALLKNRLLEEAQDFAEWYLDTFNTDLES